MVIASFRPSLASMMIPPAAVASCSSIRRVQSEDLGIEVDDALAIAEQVDV
jgi:hypothetical protein